MLLYTKRTKYTIVRQASSVVPYSAPSAPKATTSVPNTIRYNMFGRIHPANPPCSSCPK